MWLSLTSGVAFGGLASLTALVEHYPLFAASTALTATSIWYHTTHHRVAFWADQVALFTFAGVGLWDAYSHGMLPFAIGMVGGSYCVVVYYGGRILKRWVFSPDLLEEFVCHASMHVVAAGLCATILLLFLEQ
jgi:hypothetical protein